jgi:PII-like signaling protein
VQRGILGFGADGAVHGSALIDLSLDLPVVLEFYEEPDQARDAVEKLLQRFDLPHVVAFEATQCRR